MCNRGENLVQIYSSSSFLRRFWHFWKGFTGQTCAQTTGCVKFSDFDNWALSHSCICSSLTSTHCSKTTPPTPPLQPPAHLHSLTAPVPDEKYILEFNEKYQIQILSFLLDLCTKRTKKDIRSKVEKKFVRKNYLYFCNPGVTTAHLHSLG